MSWLLFLDESGHDHKSMPYEVRGGIALDAGALWPFVQAMQRLELDSFGGHLHQYRGELKGSTLLDRKRFRFAQQLAPMESEARRKHCRGFLTKGLEHKAPAGGIHCLRPGLPGDGTRRLSATRAASCRAVRRGDSTHSTPAKPSA